MEPVPLTRKQKKMFDYLAARIREQGYAPSLRQAAADLGISHTAVASLVRALEQKGWLERDGRYSRAVRLRAPRPSGREVPVVGRVAAGLPLYAQQEWESTVLVDPRLFPGDNLFGLRVQGDSMRGVGILDGDLAICRPRQFADNGEIVVALVGGDEATVKRFFLRGDHVELRPENPDFPSMRYPLDQVLVQGLVIGVQRGPDQMKKL